MKSRILDHIDLRVKDFQRAMKFYGKLLPALGFSCDRSDETWGTFYSAGGDKPSEFFGFTEDRQHQPNGTRISFWADTREGVDRIAKLVREIGGKKLQDILAGGALRATGILALFYCGVLFTEGIGVYMQKRWAEFLMIFATGALIPLEMRHVWHRLIFHRAIFAPILLLLANCFIVWFLYLVLRRDKLEKQTAPKRELIETR